MKKLYTVFFTIAALMTSVAANAVESVTELFGTWTFTANIEYLDASYKDKILNECEVIIDKDPSGTFLAEVDGLCGVENSYQSFSKFETKDGVQTLKVTNPNGGGYDAWGSLGLWMADPEGNNPFGMSGYGPLYYTVNEAGTEITLPDFSFISISDFNAEKGTIIAKVTNAKLTLKEKKEIEIADLSGSYEFNVTTFHDYEVVENWPTTLQMDITKNDDTNKSYTVTWTWEQFGTITFEGKFDGTTLSLPYANQLIANDSIYLAPTNGYTLEGKIGFNFTGKALAMSTGVSFAVPYYDEAGAVDSLSYVFWYGGGTAKVKKDEPVVDDYSGTYHAVGVVNYDSEAVATNSEGDIVIEWNESLEAYVVKKFLGYDNPFTLDYDLMYFIPDANDPSKGVFTSACLAFLSAKDDYSEIYYLATRDGNLQDNPLPVTIDEDGNMTLKDVCLAITTYMGTEADALVKWFSSIKATKAVPSPKDWVGTHSVNAVTYTRVAEGATVPTTGDFTVTYYEDQDLYLVENFLGYDLYSMNYGGLELKPDANDPHKATMECGIVDFDATTMEEVTIYDVELGKTVIEFTLNDDGTVTVGDFAIAKCPWGSAPTTVLATTKKNSPMDWVGTHSVNEVTYGYVAEGATVPTTGDFTVSYYEDWDMYLVENFLGYDLYSMNHGGLELKPDANDPHKATMECGTVDFDATTMEEFAIYDATLGKTVIEFTLNDDGTVTVGDFAIAKGPWGAAPTTVVASTQASTSIKGVETDKQVANKAIYNLSGQKVGNDYKGIVIKNVGGKMVKTLVK